MSRITLADLYGTDTTVLAAAIRRLEEANVAATPNTPVFYADGAMHIEGITIPVAPAPYPIPPEEPHDE